MSTGAYLLFLIFPWIGITFVVLLHWVLCRFFVKNPWFLLVILGVVTFIVVALKSYYFAQSHGLGYLNACSLSVVNIIIYTGLFYGYFTLMNLNITALRIRLLRMLYLSPQQQLPESELLALYHPQAVMELRLTRLLRMRQIREIAPDIYVIDRKWVWYLSQMVLGLRRLFNM